MKKEIKKWLNDRQRKYADGLTLFLSCASTDFKTKYAAFFQEVKGEPKPFDPHFTMLINKLTSIESKMRFAADKTTKENVDFKENEILSEKESKKSEKTSVKIIKEDELPEQLLKLYSRIQEITPLYAALKTEIADENLTDEQRREKAEELCALDDERREAWNIIDDWAAGEDVKLEMKEALPDEELSDDSFQRGLQLSNAIKRAKENLKRSIDAAEKFKKDGELNKESKARHRVEKYQKEIEKLEAQIKDAEKS